MNDRYIWRLELLPEAKSALEGFSSASGMTQTAALERLLEWFAYQSEVVQAAALGHVPPEAGIRVDELILSRFVKR